MDDFIKWLSLIFGRWQVWASGGGIGGAVVIILYLIERLIGWTMPKNWYVLIFVILFILSASFIVWKDEHQKTSILEQELATEKERSKPNFHIEAGVSYVSPAGKTNESSIVVVIGIIKNTGAPSIASNFLVSVNVKGVTTVGQFFPFGENIVIPALNSAPQITLHRDDYLVKKGMQQPIPTGGAVQGFLIVLVPNVKPAEILDVGSRISLSLKDASGRSYSVDQVTHGSSSTIIDIEKYL